MTSRSGFTWAEVNGSLHKPRRTRSHVAGLLAAVVIVGVVVIFAFSGVSFL